MNIWELALVSFELAVALWLLMRSASDDEAPAEALASLVFAIPLLAMAISHFVEIVP